MHFVRLGPPGLVAGYDPRYRAEESLFLGLVFQHGSAGLARHHPHEARVEHAIDLEIALLSRRAEATAIAFGALLHRGGGYSQGPNGH
jgi:hypothetical protein